MRMMMLAMIAAGATGSAWGGVGAGLLVSPARQAGPDTVVVKLVDKGPSSFAFEPAHVTAHAGDVIRFVQTVKTPHDVAFMKVPPHTNLGARTNGPFLTQPGETYDVTIDSAFKPGQYEFVCLPHMALGMRGTLQVVP